MDALTVKEMMRYMPDQSEVLPKVFGDSTGREVRVKFGMDFLWLSCWLCMVGTLSADRVGVLESAEESRLLSSASVRNVAPPGSDEVVAPSLHFLTEPSEATSRSRR
jgi:hypothetical protein